MLAKRGLARGLAVVAAIAGGLILAPAPAQAQCRVENSDILGNWVNVDRNTRGITRLQIDFACGDVVLNGRRQPTGYFVQTFGSCTPRDCDWGRVQANYRDSSEHLTAVYSPGFAQKVLSAWIVSGGPQDGQLAVTAATLFTDSSGRPNYSDTYYFTQR